MISYREIEILPFEGQHEPKELGSSNSNIVQEQVAVGAGVQEKASSGSSSNMAIQPERKTISQPTGQLKSANIGIKETLNPTKKKGLDDDELLPESNENYTQEDFEKYWKDYAFELKKQNRDGLFTTLTRSKISVGSDHTITLNIKNHQVSELETEKIGLLRHLRLNLKNTHINLVYKVEETESTSVLDSKSTFDRLAEENESLKKLRKMFNLDIEF